MIALKVHSDLWNAQ